MNIATSSYADEFMQIEDPPAPPEPPAAVPLLALEDHAPDPQATLLAQRYLCRAAGMLFVGPSGIGKSSASVQMDIAWAAGQPAFGIAPSRPLRILQIQAENDEGDLSEMVRGVIGAVPLTSPERALAAENLLVATERGRTGDAFLFEVVRPLLDMHRPDLLRIDPLLAYLGGDPADTARLSAFCRAGLDPLLSEFGCGCILNHHTPKTTNRDTAAWRPSDWMYSGAGGAELTNWARAILVVEPTGDPLAFRFIAAKRGARIGWCNDAAAAPDHERLFCHMPGTIAWRAATDDERANVRPKSARGAPEEKVLLAEVPESGPIAKDVLLARWNGLGVGQKKASGILADMLARPHPVIFEWQIPRRGTRPQLQIARRAQALL
jgi:hypothetical protein